MLSELAVQAIYTRTLNIFQITLTCIHGSTLASTDLKNSTLPTNSNYGPTMVMVIPRFQALPLFLCNLKSYEWHGTRLVISAINRDGNKQ